jgi:hypothetical protein
VGELLLSNKPREPNLGLHHSWLATSLGSLVSI